jgi:hypothetical protein
VSILAPNSQKPFSTLQRLLTGRTGYPGAGSFYGDPQDPGDTFVDYGEADLSRGSNVLERLPDDLVRQGIRPAAAAKKGEPARGMINEAEKWWPGVKAYLNATGLERYRAGRRTETHPSARRQSRAPAGSSVRNGVAIGGRRERRRCDDRTADWIAAALALIRQTDECWHDLAVLLRHGPQCRVAQPAGEIRSVADPE